MSVKIAPSILSADFGRLAEEVRACQEGGADWIHVDVMDGHFVPNITIGPAVTAAVRRATDLPVDVHLMIEDPDRYLEDFADAGADLLTVHQETCLHLHRTLTRIRELGVRAGVAVNPATPVDVLREVLPYADLVLVMTVNPGFGGQRYIPTMTGKITSVRAMILEGGWETELQVDGGVAPDTAGTVAQAGASVLVAGSAVFGHPEGVGAAMAELRRLADAGTGPAAAGESTA